MTIAVFETEQGVTEQASRFTAGTRIPAAKFHAFATWAAERPGVTPQLRNAFRSVAWLVEVDGFREREENLMVEGKYEETLADHRAALADLIADGEAIILAIGREGFDATPFQFTVADLQSTLNSLRVAFRCEHGPKNSQKTNSLVAQLFDVPQH